MKKQHTKVSVIYSLGFFALFVFTIFTLGVSQFSQSFSHLFFIFIREGQFFDTMSRLFLLCGFLLSLSFVIISSWHKKGTTPHRIFMLMFSVVFLYFFIIMKIESQNQNIEDILALEGSIYHRDFLELFIDYLPRIIVICLTYIFFVFAPLLFIILRIRPAPNSFFGEWLDSMKPSINVVIIALFALSLKPYYFRDNLYVYIDSVALLVGIVMLFIVWKNNKNLFGFYEYMNVALLCLGVIVCIFCSSLLSSSDNYFNAQYAFMLLAFISWCAEWMYENTTLRDV